MTNPEPKFSISYDEVVQHLFECLVEEGYAPSEDELLDLGDIVMDLILHVMLMITSEDHEVHVDIEEIEEEE